MRIHEVMGAKVAHHEVVSISPDASVADLIDLLSEHNIGAVIVSADGQSIAGIVSERDVVRKIKAIDSILSAPVSAIMTRKVVTCELEDTIGQLMQLMTGGKFRHLPVVVDGRLAGIVSIGDVVKARIEETVREAEAMREYIATA